MDYKEYAETYGECNVTINTRIDMNYRISSIYRKYSNSNFESWGWETILWKNDNIEKQYSVLYSSEEVVSLHNREHSRIKDFQ